MYNLLLLTNKNRCFILYILGGIYMIRYKIDILSTLKEIGYSTYKIKQEKIFNQSQLQQIRDHKLLTQEALNKVCTLLNCQPGDILEYIPDPPIKNENN